MGRRKKNIKQKLSEFTYGKPIMDKRLVDLKKGLCEISDMLNEKNKK